MKFVYFFFFFSVTERILDKKILGGTGFRVNLLNTPLPSSPQSQFQSESKCEIFFMVISSNFNMNELIFIKKDFALSLALKWRLR